MVKVLFVCMGNICRSPTAEGVFRKQVVAAGLEKEIVIDSAGTHGYHIGGQPDTRAQKAARERGIDLSKLCARKVKFNDYKDFDYLLAMDLDNLADLQSECPQEHLDKVKLFLDYSEDFAEKEVPDPYYGGRKGFEQVLDLVESASSGLLKEIVAKHKLKP